jgi:hypothetical protein
VGSSRAPGACPDQLRDSPLPGQRRAPSQEGTSPRGNLRPTLRPGEPRRHSTCGAPMNALANVTTALEQR